MPTDAASATIPRFLYGTAWKEEATQRCVEAALEAGFRGIDTANQRVHYYEAGVGQALQQAPVPRSDLFLQTKFTPRGGQDHRLPYDPNAPLATQVAQSFASSLAHLGTDWLDSYLLHSPLTPGTLGDDDWEVWGAMESLRDRGQLRHLGISNANLNQVRTLCERARIKPSFVQNRCFAKTRWDREVRTYCQQQGVIYQGFSLLTANAPVLNDERLQAIAERTGKTRPQLVFRFALDAGMLPLTGTTDPQHMRQDLQALEFELDPADHERIEQLAVS